MANMSPWAAGLEKLFGNCTGRPNLPSVPRIKQMNADQVRAHAAKLRALADNSTKLSEEAAAMEAKGDGRPIAPEVIKSRAEVLEADTLPKSLKLAERLQKLGGKAPPEFSLADDFPLPPLPLRVESGQSAIQAPPGMMPGNMPLGKASLAPQRTGDDAQYLDVVLLEEALPLDGDAGYVVWDGLRRLIKGGNGERLERIQERTGARVTLCLAASGRDTAVRIEAGSEERLEAARTLVNELVEAVAQETVDFVAHCRAEHAARSDLERRQPAAQGLASDDGVVEEQAAEISALSMEAAETSMRAALSMEALEAQAKARGVALLSARELLATQRSSDSSLTT